MTDARVSDWSRRPSLWSSLLQGVALDAGVNDVLKSDAVRQPQIGRDQKVTHGHGQLSAKPGGTVYTYILYKRQGTAMTPRLLINSDAWNSTLRDGIDGVREWTGTIEIVMSGSSGSLR